MDKELIFLVVLDDSDEVLNALRYASQRSSINNGRVALLYTFETLEFSHWKAVEDIAEVESRKEAESKIKECCLLGKTLPSSTQSQYLGTLTIP